MHPMQSLNHVACLLVRATPAGARAMASKSKPYQELIDELVAREHPPCPLLMNGKLSNAVAFAHLADYMMLGPRVGPKELVTEKPKPLGKKDRFSNRHNFDSMVQRQYDSRGFSAHLSLCEPETMPPPMAGFSDSRIPSLPTFRTFMHCVVLWSGDWFGWRKKGKNEFWVIKPRLVFARFACLRLGPDGFLEASVTREELEAMIPPRTNKTTTNAIP